MSRGAPLPTCPLLANSSLRTASGPVEITEDRTCLASIGELKGDYVLVDARSRDEFAQFHIPGAINLSGSELMTTPTIRGKRAIIYDSGKFSSDAYFLCSRLRKAGTTNFKILDGGIAAWAQSRSDPRTAELSRLSDSEVLSALLSPGSLASSLAPSLSAVLAKSIPPARLRTGTSPSRAVLLATESTPFAAIQARLDSHKGKPVSFYWTGTGEKLSQLLAFHSAQESKRNSGPAEPKGCSAL